MPQRDQRGYDTPSTGGKSPNQAIDLTVPGHGGTEHPAEGDQRDNRSAHHFGKGFPGNDAKRRDSEYPGGRKGR